MRQGTGRTRVILWRRCGPLYGRVLSMRIGASHPANSPTGTAAPSRAIGAPGPHLGVGETTMATSAERMRTYRERARRGIRRLTIEVREDDLRAIAKRGYEGAVTTDHDQQAQAVGLFLTDSLVQI
jgi:hypothetical protein